MGDSFGKPNDSIVNQCMRYTCYEYFSNTRKKLGRDRLEIQMSDSTSDSPKSSDRFDNSETKIRNHETCLEASFTVSSVVYKAAGVDLRYKH